MPARKPMTSKALVRKLTRTGVCEITRQRGSHATLRCGDSCQTVVPMHAKELPRGTQKSIEKAVSRCLPGGTLDGLGALKMPKGQWVEVPGAALRKMPDVRKDWYKLIEDTYRPIGGHVDFSKPEDLVDEVYVWQAIDLDDDPQADVVESTKRTPFGRKGHATATDKSPAAKKAMMDRKAQNLKTPGNYGEVSDAMAHVLLTRTDVPVVEDPVLVRKVLKGKDVKWIGCKDRYPGKCGWYSRKLGGKMHDKIMVGIPHDKGGALDGLGAFALSSKGLLLLAAALGGAIIYKQRQG